MRYWEELDADGKVIRTIVMNKKSLIEDFKWIMNNLPGTWRPKK